MKHRREYERTNVLVLLFWPYVRLALIVFVILLAGLAESRFPNPGHATIFTVCVILLKLFVDFATHQHEHHHAQKQMQRSPR